ncbi:MAG: hypothetical protein EB127_31860, partial [Alphaproteobacteria bacterium]|nr:hypothetical protein [Alphaproteobacteria bacterium]
ADCGDDIVCNERMNNMRVEINNDTSDEAKKAYSYVTPTLLPASPENASLETLGLQDSTDTNDLTANPVPPRHHLPPRSHLPPLMKNTENDTDDNDVAPIPVSPLPTYSLPPMKQNTYNISSSNYASQNIQLINTSKFIPIQRADSSLPTGYTKVWNPDTREYMYQDENMQVTTHPVLPSKRTNTSRVKRPSSNSFTFNPLPIDIKIDSDKTVTLPWIKYFDTNIRKYFYYNTKTYEEKWEHPFPPRYPVSGEMKYGDSGLPNGWEKYLDESTNTYFYYNTITTEVTWDHPNPPPFPDGLEKIPNNTLPSTYVMYRDPTTGTIFYYNNITTETFWTLTDIS